MVKVSANFTPRGFAALNQACALTGDTRTDALNRAVQVYAYLTNAAEDGKLVFVENPVTGARERVVFF